MARRAIFSAESVVDGSSAVATVKVSPRELGMQFTIDPAVDSNDASTASGTFTVEFRAPDTDYYESVVDKDGVALSLDLSNGPLTHKLDGKYDRLKVTSDNSSDEFTVAVR